MQQGNGPLVYYAFDVLEADGEPLLDLPLARAAQAPRPSSSIAEGARFGFSEAFEDGLALFDAAKEQGLEGIVAKKAESRYQPGKRTRDWLKVKTHQAAGVHRRRLYEGEGTPGGLARLARPRGHAPAASSSTSATSAPASPRTRSSGCWPAPTARAPTRRLSARSRRCPGCARTTSSGSSPRLVAEVEFAEWTHDGRLRAPVYKGLREDKEPTEVRSRGAASRPRSSKGKRVAPALEPRQAVLAGGRHHEGRPDRVLPGRRARALSRISATARSR